MGEKYVLDDLFGALSGLLAKQEELGPILAAIAGAIATASNQETTNAILAAIRDQSPEPADVVFHNAASAPADGPDIAVGRHNNLMVSIAGVCDSRTVAFQGIGPGGVMTPMTGVRLADMESANQTSGLEDELWLFAVGGLTAVRMPLVDLSGSTTVKGRLS
ncbi:MAG: hypothetical protein ACM3ZC_15490 [Bacteroidota bacterium]